MESYRMSIGFTVSEDSYQLKKSKGLEGSHKVSTVDGLCTTYLNYRT